MKEQLVAMLEMQDRMNAKVHPQWRSQNFPWYRAIWIESAELMDHQGWKWWKHQTADREQVLLELVDIWHFGLSDLLQGGQSTEQVAASLSEVFALPETNDEFLILVERFAGQVLTQRRFVLDQFLPLLAAAGLSLDQLFRHYVGKNVLNFFRQDNGYKSGTYRKLWQGKEDNEHLAEVLKALDSNSASFADDVYHALRERYAAEAVADA